MTRQGPPTWLAVTVLVGGVLVSLICALLFAGCARPLPVPDAGDDFCSTRMVMTVEERRILCGPKELAR